MSAETRDMIMQRRNSPDIAQRALADGDLSKLIDDGFTKVRAGQTTLSEVARALSG
jgi:type II secretory ATPase GspE/PulE/Tfp pilus assembly ATPase PilB-like protein